MGNKYNQKSLILDNWDFGQKGFQMVIYYEEEELVDDLLDTW